MNALVMRHADVARLTREPARSRVTTVGRVGMKAGALAMRLARIPEREALEQLQRRSSMHEPMYRAQLAAHPDAIELPAEQITEGLVQVAEQNGAIVGFAVLLERSADACEPRRPVRRAGTDARWRRRRLVEDDRRIARERGATRIDVVANPQAVAFYEAVGFTTVGEARTRFGRAPRMSLPVVG